MSAIQHINYRHAYNSGFSNVSRFPKDTSIKDIRSYVDQAIRYGNVTANGKGRYIVDYKFDHLIGVNSAGKDVCNIRVYIHDGSIQTEFPL